MLDRIDRRLHDKFAISRKDARIMAREVLLELVDCVADSDELKIPFLGTFTIKSHLRDYNRSWSRSLGRFVAGSAMYNRILFKPITSLKMKVKLRKIGALSRVGVQNLVDNKKGKELKLDET